MLSLSYHQPSYWEEQLAKAEAQKYIADADALKNQPGPWEQALLGLGSPIAGELGKGLVNRYVTGDHSIWDDIAGYFSNGATS